MYGKYWEEFVVEIGAKEIFVEVYSKKGSDEPAFRLEAGTDWEGFPVPLSEDERAAAIRWVMETYGI